MPEPDLLAEYRELWRIADAMDRLLQDARVDFCAEIHANLKAYGASGRCPLCVARARFASRCTSGRPRLVDALVLEQNHSVGA